jgi:hypothetical protein
MVFGLFQFDSYATGNQAPGSLRVYASDDIQWSVGNETRTGDDSISLAPGEYTVSFKLLDGSAETIQDQDVMIYSNWETIVYP